MVYDVYIQNLQGPDTVYPNFKVGTLGTVKVWCVLSFPAYTQKQPPEVFFKQGCS